MTRRRLFPQMNNTTEKRCTKCGETKLLEYFHVDNRKKDGHVSRCKMCQSKYASEHYNANKSKYSKMRKNYYQNNKDEILENQRKYYQSNKEQKTVTVKNWRKNNPEKIKEIIERFKQSHPDCGIKATKRWRKNNPEKVRELKRNQYARYKKNPAFRISGSISNGIRYSLGKGGKSQNKWECLVNFTAKELMCHLEKQFKDGMTWDNYGNYWHIDHIIPIAVFNFKTPEDIDFKRCWALENLQPLEAKENMRKNAKFDGDFQPSLPLAI
jgi:hypothetical protein